MGASGDDLLQVFHEEADELLATLEDTLLSIERSGPSEESLGEAFRLLHTLKGTCSMYGFSTAAGLAHEVETLFSRVRDGSLQLDAGLLDLALRARDSMAVLVSGSESEAAGAREVTQALMDGMQAYVASSPDADCAQTADRGDDDEMADYRIRIEPRGDLFVRGVGLAGLVREIASLGDCELVVDESAVPALGEIDPEQCYLSVVVAVRTAVGRRAIEEALMFLDEGEYAIEHVAEEQAAPAGSAGSTPSLSRGVRVPTERLDGLVDLVGELVTAQVSLRDLAAERDDQRLTDIAESIEMLAQSLRESVLGMRMIPIGTTFGRFSRYARDLARELGKDVLLETEGGAAELDRGVIERIEEPLLHLIRNSLDHGIEPPVQRRAAGKPERGTVRLAAYHSGGSMYIRVSDDGRGIDLEAVAREAGLSAPDADGDTRPVLDRVFDAGLSTADTVTSLSGRGVGLDAVRRAVERLQGAVDIESVPGQGVTVTIRLPLTLAIIDGLLVAVGDDRYILPLTNVEECVEFAQQPQWREHGRDLVDVRGELVPFARLREVFGVGGVAPDDGITVIANVDGERFGLVVDEVVDRMQVVIKTLGRGLRRSEGFAGASMLGDGRVALIVDIGQVRRLAGMPRTADRMRTGGTP